jgi:DNA-binding IclR family transcriptional regulator
VAESAPSQTIASVERAMDVLLVFASGDQQWWGITDIARALDMPKAAVHRVLSSLRTRDIVSIDPETHRYALGPAMITLGLAALNGIEIRHRAQRELSGLSEATQETATLSIRVGDSRMYLDQVTPRRAVLMSVSLGVLYPLHAGSSSKAFLAFLPDDEIDAYLAGTLERVTEATEVDAARILEDLRRIRARGFAESVGERQPGAASVAAPILEQGGTPVAVLSVCGPANRFPAERDAAVRALLAVTTRLSAENGYRVTDVGR